MKRFTDQWMVSARSLLLGLAIVAIVLGLTGIVAIAHLFSESVTAAQSSRLVLSVTTAPKTFNVALNEEAVNIFDLTYASLLRQKGGSAELLPDLAESWQVSDNGQRIEFVLREGLQWSDGQPITVEDVLFTFNSVCFNPDVPTLLRDILRIGESGKLPTVQAKGDRQIEVISPEPFAPLLRSIGSIPIMPKHAMEPFLTRTAPDAPLPFLSAWGTDTPPNQIVSSGAYRLASYTSGQRVVFQRHPDYWRWSADTASPQPIEEIVWEIVESSDTSLMQFRSGNLDVVSVSAPIFSLLKREEERGQFTVYNGGPQLSTSYVMFNLNKGRRNGQPLVDPVKSAWFNTQAFRQAIAHSLNRPAMINNILQGLGTVQHSSIALQSPFHLSPEAGLPTYDYDPEQAKTVLRSAGFVYDADNQLHDWDGNRVRFTLMHPTGSSTIDAIATQVQRDLGAIGIQLDLQGLSFNALVDRITTTLDWEAQILGTTGTLEPNSGISTWSPDGRLHDFNLRPDDETSIVGREVADWEARIGQLYQQAAQAMDVDTRYQLYAEAQTLAQTYVPVVYLINPLALVAVRDRVDGVQYSAVSPLLWNITELQVRSPSAG
jgi:peptide/nickel transport system substrate-binding protein